MALLPFDQATNLPPVQELNSFLAAWCWKTVFAVSLAYLEPSQGFSPFQ